MTGVARSAFSEGQVNGKTVGAIGVAGALPQQGSEHPEQPSDAV